MTINITVFRSSSEKTGLVLLSDRAVRCQPGSSFTTLNTVLHNIPKVAR